MTDDGDTWPPKPRVNADLIGHETAERTVAEAWQSGRFPHAWLIGGPRGIGKATLAYRMARWVLAGGPTPQSGLFGEAPGALALPREHGVFHRIAAGGHADFRVLEPAEGKASISVEDAREIVRFVHQTAAEGAWKAVIVDSADELTRNAANAILKIVEEPPPKTLFLLVSHAPGRLLPTIRSRCRSLALTPPSDSHVEDLLSRYAPDLPVADAAVLAKLSEGSIGRALDYAAAGGIDLYRGTMILLSDPRTIEPDRLYGLADMLSAKSTDNAYGTFRTLLDWWMKRALKAQATGLRPPPAVPEEEAALDRWCALGPLETCMGLWEKLTGLLAQSDPPANLDKRQLVVSAFLEIQKVAARQS